MHKIKTGCHFLLVAITLSFILYFYLFNNLYKKQVEQIHAQNTEHLQAQNQIPDDHTQTESNKPPVRLKIPIIHVDASIEYMGLTPSGAMEVPNNTIDVGWFGLGPRPGEKGSAVIGGHFDGKNGEAGVFTDLYKLKTGDKLYVEDDKGISTVFIVQKIRTYDPGYAEEVFTKNDGAHLNLITCDGVWDGTKKSYTKRLVVFADLI